MATYEIKSPDGQTWEVNAPDTASEAEVMAYAQAAWEPTRAAGGGRGFVNQADATDKKGQLLRQSAAQDLSLVDRSNLANRWVGERLQELKDINPGASVDQLAALAGEDYKQASSTPLTAPTDRVRQYVDAKYDITNARENAKFDEGVQSRINLKAMQAAPDERGDRVSIGYNPNTEADRVAAEIKAAEDVRELAIGREAAAGLNPVIRGMVKGGVQSVGLTAASAGYLGDLLGSDALKQWGLDTNNKTGKIANELTLSQGATDISSVDEFQTWLAENGGYVAYQAAEAILTGGLVSGMSKQAARQSAIEATALGLNSLRQTLGSVYSDAMEESKRTGKPPPSLLQIAAGAVGSAAIDTAADKLGLDALTASGFKGSALTRLSKSISSQMGIQGGTEALQLVPEELGTGRDPFRDGMAKQFLDEAAVGALGGTGPGVVGAINRYQAAPAAAPRVENQPTTPIAPVVPANPVNAPAAQAVNAIESLLGRQPSATADPIAPINDDALLAAVPVEGANDQAAQVDPVPEVPGGAPAVQPAAVDRAGQVDGKAPPAVPDPVQPGAAQPAAPSAPVQSVIPAAADPRTAALAKIEADLQASKARQEAKAQEAAATAQAEQEKAAAADLAKRSVGSAYQQTSATPTPQTGGAVPSPQLVTRMVQRAADTFAKNSDLTDAKVYPEPVLYGIINSEDVGPDLLSAARTELDRRRGTLVSPTVNYTGAAQPGATSLGVGGQQAAPAGVGNPVAGQQGNASAAVGQAVGGQSLFTSNSAAGSSAAPTGNPREVAPVAPPEVIAAASAQIRKARRVQFTTSTEPLTTGQQIASAFANANGRTFTVVEQTQGAKNAMPNGFMVPGTNHIVVAHDANDAPVLVAVHEIYHGLPTQLRLKTNKALRALFKEDQASEFGREFSVTPEQFEEEIPAYMAQAVAARPTFWQELRTKMGNRDFAALASHILNKFKELMSGADAQLGEGFLQKYIGEESKILEAQRILTDVYTESMREQGLQPDAAVMQAPMFSSKPIQVGDYQTVQNKDGSMTIKGDAAEIRALLPDGIQGRVTKDGVAFTNSDAPRVRHALEGNNTAYSRGGQVTEKLAMTKDGKYLGAPEQFNTPGKIPTLRKLLMKLTKEGEAGRYWYENSSKAVLHMVGGDKVEARKFAALLAIYSPQAKVDTNGTFALRAWAQYKAGQPISVKTGVMDRKAQNALDNVDEFWNGEKTGNFVTNLLRNIDPELAQGATIDMWMMRAAQYNNDAPTKTQYAFMENETNRIARELGWEPQQVQAAIWVAMKARMENQGVKDAVEAKSEKKGWISYDRQTVVNPKTGKSKIVKGPRVILNEQKHRDNWIDQAMAYDPATSDTQRAKFDFEDSLLRHIGLISFEARPSRNSGVLPGIHDAPYDLQLEFQNAVQSALYNDDGADMLAAKLGLMIYKETNVPGVWQGEVSPSTQKSTAMAPTKGTEGKPGVDAAQKKALNAYAAILGYLTKQDGVGWHRPFYSATKGESNGLDIVMGRPVTPEEAGATEKAVGTWMVANGKEFVPDDKGVMVPWNQQFAFVSSPDGIRLINFGAVSNMQLQTVVLKAVEPALPDGQVDLFKSDGFMPGNDWKENPDGRTYIERASAEGSSDVLGWARTVLGERIQGVFDEYSKKYGWGNPGVAFSNKSDGGASDLSDSVLRGRTDAGGGARGRQAADGALRDSPQEVARAPLAGAPAVPGFNGPDPQLVAVAEQYAKANGIALKRQSEYAGVDAARAQRLSDAYADMRHAPNDPKVKEAYANLIKQTTEQYRALEKAGYKFWFMDMSREDNQGYASSPWNAMRDIRANKKMGVFPTSEGFGSGDVISDNPLETTTTPFSWPVGGLDGEMKPVLANDLFRAVHDAFGHGLEGAGFRAQGEENAWQAHRRLFTGTAIGALTSETRGQNSYVNFGPKGDTNSTATAEDTAFADQKTGLMPSWTWTEGVVGSEGDANLDQDITLTIPVEGGKVAKLTVNAAVYIKQLDARQSALEMVKECML